MAKRTSAAKIGAFVLGGLAIAIGVLLAVGSGRWFSQSVERAVLFDESLQGLQVGAAVSYNGIPVGQVDRITGTLALKDNDIRTAVVISLRGGSIIADGTDAGIGEIVDRLVASGLRAQLATASFVTGTLYVSLVFAPDADAYPAPEEFLDLETLPAVPSDRARLGRLATSLGEQLPQAIDQLSRLVENLSATFDDENRASLSEALAGFAELGTSLGDAGPQIDQLVSEAATAVGRVATLVERLDALVANLDGTIDTEAQEINAALGELRKATESFTGVMGRLDSVLAATRGPLSEFASEGLPQFTGLATEAGAAVRQLGQLLDRIEAEGAGFLLQGAPLPEYVPRSR
jgi:paraquat-inducible protein B